MKTDRAKLVKALDDVTRKIVRLRDNHTCQKCGKYVEGAAQHVSHVIPVSAGNKLRWEPDNMKILCFHHHINWWHKNPLEATEWFANKFPDRMKYLQENRGIQKFTTSELQDLLTYYKARLKEYQE